jgi:hypothetical protein
MKQSRNRKCQLCPTWVEPSSRHPHLCPPCWRLLDTIQFKAESLTEHRQRALPFDPFRTARTRAKVSSKPAHGHAGIVVNDACVTQSVESPGNGGDAGSTPAARIQNDPQMSLFEPRVVQYGKDAARQREIGNAPFESALRGPNTHKTEAEILDGG